MMDIKPVGIGLYDTCNAAHCVNIENYQQCRGKFSSGRLN